MLGLLMPGGKEVHSGFASQHVHKEGCCSLSACAHAHTNLKWHAKTCCGKHTCPGCELENHAVVVVTATIERLDPAAQAVKH